MDPSDDFPISRSPRKELLGPRPPALKVRKDSHKINKKPPVAPPPQQQHHHQQQPQQIRPPVIIYTVSPKVIHTNPSDFMSLVQRLTGSSSSSSTTNMSNTSSSNPFNDDVGAISPAARYATIEKANKQSPKEKKLALQQQSGDVGFVEGVEIGQVMERSSLFPGILSPGPAALPPISPNFFSPLDPNAGSFFHDLISPALHSNRNFLEGSFMLSPSNFVSPLIASPTTSIDLFNNFNNSFNNNNLFD